MMPLPGTLQNLKVNKTRDFFDFYVTNKVAVDYIVDTNISTYGGDLDKNDLHQDILLRMHRNSILKRYQPHKSKLNTYLTNCVRGYIRTAKRETLKKNRWNPWPTQEKKILNGVSLTPRAARTIPFQDAYREGQLMLTENSAEEELFMREVVEIVKSKMSHVSHTTGKDLSAKIFELLADDQKKIEIAKILHCSSAWVGQVAAKIADLGATLIAEPDTCRN